MDFIKEFYSLENNNFKEIAADLDEDENSPKGIHYRKMKCLEYSTYLVL